MNDLMKNFIFFALTVNSYVDPGNYSSPIKYFIDTHVFQSSIDFYKRVYISISNNTFDRDDGWLLEDTQKLKYAQITNIRYDILKYNPGATPLVAFTFDSPNLVDYYNRSYVKIQDLIAKIGGLINASFIIMYLITFDYLRFTYLVDINKKLGCLDKRASNMNNIKDVNLKGERISAFVDKSNFKAINDKSIKQDKIGVEENSKVNKSSIKIECKQINQDNSMFQVDFNNNSNNENISFSYFSYIFCCFFKDDRKNIKARLEIIRKKLSINTFVSFFII